MGKYGTEKRILWEWEGDNYVGEKMNIVGEGRDNVEEKKLNCGGRGQCWKEKATLCKREGMKYKKRLHKKRELDKNSVFSIKDKLDNPPVL